MKLFILLSLLVIGSFITQPQAQCSTRGTTIELVGGAVGSNCHTLGLSYPQIVVEAESECALVPDPLFVSLESFNAQRIKSKVNLKWETASENNNNSFEVLRKVSKGGWKTIALIFSQTDDGNSNSLLTYEYTDVNTSKGISQYRLRQVDRDRQVTYSHIYSVDGYNKETGKTLIYPNPSPDGNFTLVFEDKSTNRNVSVSDISGCIVKQYRNVSSSSIVIDQLENGIYNIHITDLNMATTTVEKVIINKR